jgi:dipeptidyl aminopeptidase/acylaminoacyl peptidase
MVGTQRPVEFTVDGSTLVGTMHMPKGGGKVPAVLFCHGFTGNRIESNFLFVKMSRDLVRRGIASLRFDFRGSGESDGEFRDMTVRTEIADARRALAFLARAKGIDGHRIGVLGFSLGGLIAACISADRAVRSAVLWAAVAHLKEITDKMLAARMEQFRGNAVAGARIPPVVDMEGHQVGRGFFEAADKERPLEHITRSKAPVLVIHGDRDESVPLQHARDYHHALLAAGARSTLKVFAGGDHVFADVEIAGKVRAETADWFEATL